MKIIRVPQRSPEWHEARRGIPTASSFNKIVTSNGSPSKQAEGYLYQLVAERLAGVREEAYISPAMLEGIAREAESRRVYAMLREVEVEEVGFCIDDSGRYGCSPDGLIGEDGVLELKNPQGKAAVEYLVSGTLPTAYVQQVQGQLLVTGREWCDFVSYYPGLPTLIVRVERDEGFISKLRDALEAFCDRLDEVCKVIRDESHS